MAFPSGPLSRSLRACFAPANRITAHVWSNRWQYIYGRMMLPRMRDNIKEAPESFALDYLRANQYHLVA